MTNETILKKAIEKTVKNGYKPDGLLGGWLKGEIGVGMEENLYIHLLNLREYYVYIYSKDFAKALWGEGMKNFRQKDTLNNYFPMEMVKWEFHLSEMVLEKDPIKYLEKFI